MNNIKTRTPSSLFLSLVLCLAPACDDSPPYPIAEFDPTEVYPGGDTTNWLLLGSNAFIRVASNLSRENEAMFYSGNSWFNQSWIQAPASAKTRDGLGPLYNATSCSGCHPKDGRGRTLTGKKEAENLGLLMRLSIPGKGINGNVLPDPNYGDQLQPFSLPDIPAEGTINVRWEEQSGTYADGTRYSLRKPSYTISDLNYGPLHPKVMLSPRIAPSVIGLGLLEAISKDDLSSLADKNDENQDGISGKRNLVWSSVSQSFEIGRFGWKGEQPGVREQVVSAFSGDIGITSSLVVKQNCTATQTLCKQAMTGGNPELEDHILDRLTVYTQAVAVPVRRAADDIEVLRGKLLFMESGCADCHVPKHVTGQGSDLAAMNQQTIWPYTDLLLHDMGEGLADHRPVFDATGTEWRTPPLWGLGLIPVVNKHNELLHDGRARGFAEAILWHGGEATNAKEAFRSLSLDKRNALIKFLGSL